MRQSAARAATAGLIYFAAVFAAGFVLGTGRVLVLVPVLGESSAVLVELPVMLYLSWVATQRISRGFNVPEDLTSRGLMGGIAFTLLMTAELGVSMVLFGRTLMEHLEHYRDAPALLGLVGQVAFAAFPALQARLGDSGLQATSQ